MKFHPFGCASLAILVFFRPVVIHTSAYSLDSGVLFVEYSNDSRTRESVHPKRERDRTTRSLRAHSLSKAGDGQGKQGGGMRLDQCVSINRT